MAKKKSPSTESPAVEGVAEQLQLFELPAQTSPVADRAAPKVPMLGGLSKPGESVDLERLESEMTSTAREFALKFRLGKLADSVNVVWNKRMRTSAGRAHYQECRIELNPRLVEIEQGSEEVERTFLHELAHLVAHHRHRGENIAPHGPEWRRACADLGIPGEGVYHQLPFEGRKVRRYFAYRCPVCATEIERVRRFRRAVACYACCNKHSGGRYAERFRLIMRPL